MTKRIVLRVLAVATALSSVAMFAPAAGATAPSPFVVVHNSASSSTGNGVWTLTIGDSLIESYTQGLADNLRSNTSRSTYVAASAGSSMPNWLESTWLDNPQWGGPNLSRMVDYENFFKPRVTIIALGSNDARIITSNPSSYTSGAHLLRLVNAINIAKQTSKCVMLTTVANHWSSSASTAAINSVNSNITWAAANNAGVAIADWKTVSAGHEEYFAAPNDIHHTATGKLVYANLITQTLRNMIAVGC